MKELKYWRDRIDEIDAGILRLLSRRARLALQLGKLKRNFRLPYRAPQRERAVLARLTLANRGPLNDRSIEKLFRVIMRETRRLQQNSARWTGENRGGIA
jgi:chorismate mutase/prephenate dehydratase